MKLHDITFILYIVLVFALIVFSILILITQQFNPLAWKVYLLYAAVFLSVFGGLFLGVSLNRYMYKLVAAYVNKKSKVTTFDS